MWGRDAKEDEDEEKEKTKAKKRTNIENRGAQEHKQKMSKREMAWTMTTVMMNDNK